MITALQLSFIIIIGIYLYLCVKLAKIIYKNYALQNQSPAQQTPTRCMIAILTPSLASPNNLLLKGFLSYLKKFAPFEFDILECNAELSQKKALSWAQHLTNEKNISLVYTVGIMCTEALSNIATKKTKPFPIVSGGIVDDLLSETSLRELQKKIPFTAITSKICWNSRIKILKKICPDIKKVLIFFKAIEDMNHQNLKEKNDLIASLRKQHIGYEMHHIEGNNQRKTHTLPPHLSKEIFKDIDFVIMSFTGWPENLESSIFSACQTYNIPTLGNVPGISKAFISLTTDTEANIGKKCAESALQILSDNKHASDIEPRTCSGTYIITIQTKNIDSLITSNIIEHALKQNNTVNLILE